MKSRTNNVFGIDYTIQQPENLAEAIEICGNDEAVVLEHFVQKLIYNHHNAEVRAAFCEALAESTGEARHTETKTNASGKEVTVYTETETEYVNRVAASEGVDVGEYAGLLQEIADKNRLDGTRRQRSSSGPKSAGKTYIALAQSIIDKGSAAKAAAVLTAEGGKPVSEDLMDLAFALKARDARIKAQQMADLNAAIA